MVLEVEMAEEDGAALDFSRRLRSANGVWRQHGAPCVIYFGQC
jgi:hypothetical protein